MPFVNVRFEMEGVRNFFRQGEQIYEKVKLSHNMQRILVHFQYGHKGFLRKIYLSDSLHTFFTRFLFL